MTRLMSGLRQRKSELCKTRRELLPGSVVGMRHVRSRRAQVNPSGSVAIGATRVLRANPPLQLFCGLGVPWQIRKSAGQSVEP